MHIVLFVENTHLEWLFDHIASQSFYDLDFYQVLRISFPK